MSQVEQELKTVRERVTEILAVFPEARDDDRILMKAYYGIHHGIEMPDELMAQGVPTMETIRRTRQSIQQEGDYLPADDKVLKRRRRAYEFKTFFSKN